MPSKTAASGRIGQHVLTVVGAERVHAYVPPPLPPDPPPRTEPLLGDIEAASQALGRLDGVASVLPGPPLFLYMYVRKEALLSSQIEGTESSLADLLLYENAAAPGVPIDDVEEVSSYVAAMSHGLARLRGGFPLSSRLIREIHAILLATGRGSRSQPGEFRRSQNWVGGTRPGNALYVPPPADKVPDCMGELERFLHSESPAVSTLIKAGLAHVQFESIHPFLDGNGRLGRLLITLLLCAEGVLKEPVLYLSLYFKAHRRRYYDLLQRVREEGDWETWLAFFLAGVKETADQAADTARRVLAVFHDDRARIEALGRASTSALRVHELLQRTPMISIPKAAEELALSRPAAAHAIAHLEDLGIVREVTARRRGRLFAYDRYVAILGEGTQPLRGERS